jgi:hypothetical protein
MRLVLASDRGGELYGQRQAIIEPVFANTNFNRGIDRFRRRGRAAVRTEWRLITAPHNLLNLHRHALAAASAGRGRPQPPHRPKLTFRESFRQRRPPQTYATASPERSGVRSLPPCAREAKVVTG